MKKVPNKASFDGLQILLVFYLKVFGFTQDAKYSFITYVRIKIDLFFVTQCKGRYAIQNAHQSNIIKTK